MQKGVALVTAPNSSEGTEQPTTSSLKAADIALSDPLRTETRRARLYLLGVSMVGITIVHTGLVPQEITTLGITFGQADRQSLLGILALITLYFLVTFATYGVSDFIYWRQAYSNAHWSELAAMSQIAREAAERAKQSVKQAAAGDLGTAKEWKEAYEKEFEEFEEALAKVEEEQRVKMRAISIEGAVGFAIATRSVATSDFKGISPLTPDERAILRYSALSPTVSSVRTIIEFLLPLLVGLYAIYALVGSTVRGAIIVCVATVVAAFITVLAVRRRRRGQTVAVRSSRTATEAVTEAATRVPASQEASQASLTAQRPSEEAPEEPQEQPRDR